MIERTSERFGLEPKRLARTRPTEPPSFWAGWSSRTSRRTFPFGTRARARTAPSAAPTSSLIRRRISSPIRATNCSSSTAATSRPRAQAALRTGCGFTAPANRTVSHVNSRRAAARTCQRAEWRCHVREFYLSIAPIAHSPLRVFIAEPNWLKNRLFLTNVTYVDGPDWQVIF